MATETTAPQLTQKPLFFYNWFCPYAHRVWIALKARGLDHDEFHMDLTVPRPPWYLELNPLGKVPLICYKEGPKQHALNESLLLLDWVAEYPQGDHSLLPPTAGDRARARWIATRYDTKFVPNWLKLMFKTDNKEDAQAVAKEMREELTWLESQLDLQGPYFLGSEFSTLDAAVLPWLLRDFLLLQYRGLDLLHGFPKLRAYKEAAEQLPAVQATLVPLGGGEYKPALVQVYLKNGGHAVDYFS